MSTAHRGGRLAAGHEIFLSYASEDLERVCPLIRALEQRGWRVWWDRTMLQGEDYEEVIDQAIAAARCVIVAWSQSSASSRWVRAEANEGRRQGKLVPVVIDEVIIPLSFRPIQTANLTQWQEGEPHQEFEKVCRTGCRRKRSGNTPAGLGRRRRIVLVMM